MADIDDLSANDLAVAERMAQLPASMLGLDDEDDIAQEDPKAGQDAGDGTEAPDEIRDEPEGDDEPQTPDVKEPLAADGEQEFEIEDANGEKRTVSLSNLIEAERELSAFKHEKEQVLGRIENEAQEQAQQSITQARSYLDVVGTQLNAVLELIQPPQGPSVDMLNPNSPNYNPDQYHLDFARHQGIMAQFQKVQTHAKQIASEKERLDEQARTDRVRKEYQKLVRIWPDWGDSEKAKVLHADMTQKLGKYYGAAVVTKLNDFTDHELFLVARDALALRAMKEKGGDVKAKVVAKAAAKAKPSDAPRKQNLTSEDATHMRHRQLLKQTGNIRNAAKAFEKFV